MNDKWSIIHGDALKVLEELSSGTFGRAGSGGAPL